MEAQHVPSFWDKLIPNMENNRFGTVSIVILITGCLGGITVSQGAYDSWIQLALLIVPLMVTVTILLAGLSMRSILNAMVVTVLVDLAVLLFNIFA
jgi:hypothetical protein